ncbi:hypothetical protein [Clostridium butyricum]|uniref:hypothetical protein n=1 Tax=Clostridium butyricum TaxID=1492 RepID=UPI000424F282|nr:hypothetical protein [Clostridium butyricum]
MCKSTDVSGSIAGYYYQILLACRELTSNISDLKEVGIEAGADVRIIKLKGVKESIEAKFHKDNMSRYDKEIIKTIYNFYRNSCDDKSLQFSTNVAPTREHKDFFDSWNKKLLKDEEMNMYILKCIFRHCCFNVSSYKENYSQYKEYISLKEGNGKREPYYIDKLEGYIFNKNVNDKELEKYSFVNSKDLDKEFSKKLLFTFYDTKKIDTINTVKNNIKENLRKICMLDGNQLEEKDYEKIRDLIIDKFFMLITENSELPSDHLFSDIKKFSKQDFYNCIENYKDERIEFLNNSVLEKIIKSIEDEESNFIKMLGCSDEFTNKDKLMVRRSEIQQLFLDKIIDIDKYNKFISMYTIEGFNSFEVVLKIINQLTIISVYKHINIDDISFFMENNKSLDNIFIKNLLNYSFKACPPSYGDFSVIMKMFYNNTNQKYSINSNQIVTFQADFGREERPCEQDGNSLNCLLDIAATDEILEKDIVLYRSINYRCSDCIYISRTNSKTLKNLNDFLECRGCKK